MARFEVLLDGARHAARDGSWATAADQARAALALWRGEPLADVESQALALSEVPRLAEPRLQAAELRIDAELRSRPARRGHRRARTDGRGQASAQHAAALTLAIQCGDQHERARAQSGLACAGQTKGEKHTLVRS